MSRTSESLTRRRFLSCGALLGAVSVAGCASGGTDGGGDGDPADDTGGSDGGDSTRESGSDGENAGDDSSDPAYADWLADAPNYDGTAADRTGMDTVTVSVGAGNGLLFEPPAVEVTPGTTVVWEWTGIGGQHNVKEVDGAFESQLSSAEGTTFEWTFDEPGVARYLCVPHEALGMKGVVDVVEG